jgi:hypothetical protein
MRANRPFSRRAALWAVLTVGAAALAHPAALYPQTAGRDSADRPAATAQEDPHFGIWRLNVAKSTFDPGPPLKSQTRWYEPYRGGMRARVETIDANGNRTVGGYVAYFNGRDYPNTTDDSDAITISLTRVGGFTIEGTLKRGREVILTTSNVVSQDGRVMTLTEKGIGPDRAPFTNVQVYDKQ